MKLPKPINKDGTKYHYVAMKVLSRDNFGRPLTFEVCYDEDKVPLVGGETFWLLMAPEAMFALKNRSVAWIPK